MKSSIKSVPVVRGYDIAIIEIGGTVGDIESLPFMEAVRQMQVELGRTHSLLMHLTLVPYIASAGESKTKPTQHSVKELRSIGLQPDVLICRSEQPISEDNRQKLHYLRMLSHAASSYAKMPSPFIKFHAAYMSKIWMI